MGNNSISNIKDLFNSIYDNLDDNIIVFEGKFKTKKKHVKELLLFKKKLDKVVVLKNKLKIKALEDYLPDKELKEYDLIDKALDEQQKYLIFYKKQAEFYMLNIKKDQDGKEHVKTISISYVEKSCQDVSSNNTLSCCWCGHLNHTLNCPGKHFNKNK